jgi:lysophospholipase L1-like esterase
LLGAKSALESAFGDLVTVDAKVSRQFEQGTALLAGLRVSGRLGDFVVVHLGSNGILNDAMFDRMSAVLRDVPRVFFLTVNVPREWESRVNDVLRRGAARSDNVSIIDWWAATQTRPEIFAADGFHIGASGAQLVVDLVAAEF